MEFVMSEYTMMVKWSVCTCTHGIVGGLDQHMCSMYCECVTCELLCWEKCSTVLIEFLSVPSNDAAQKYTVSSQIFDEAQKYNYTVST